jgi:phosphoserine phosphatase RsbU/P
MLIALWDETAGEFTIANAGSVQPMLVTPNPRSLTDAIQVQTIQIEGFPLGLFPNATYDQSTVKLAPGDFVVFFSDGIPDAINADNEMFGSDRLTELLRQHPTAHTSACAAVDAILEAVSTFQAGMDHFDDETLVVLRAL